MTFPYVVQKGDTLYRIGRRFAVNLQSLISANAQLTDTQYIVPGQVINIPVRTTNLYVIQAGDTFFYIARRFNISINELLAANPGVDPRRLRIGQTIVLPIGKSMDIVDTKTQYGYEELLEDLRLLQSAYPMIERQNIGQTVMGKQIPAVRLGNGPKQVHYNGSFHANEWITTVLLMKFIEDYAMSYTSGSRLRGYDIRALFQQTTLWIVPMVNPDGVELVQEGITPRHPFYEQLLAWNNDSFDFSRWKANIRGVDLNDQFPAFWEVEKQRRAAPGPGPRDYPGTAPLTEPESIAMADFTRRHSFQHVMAFHTQGRELYWNYRDMEPEQAENIANRFGRVSGYTPVKLSGSDAGYKDWFILEFRRLGFTIEAGSGTNPLPISLFPQMYEEVIRIMLEGLVVA